ncbi:hypothetical protein CVD28_11030 [Bacillus sp. M6-12]|nr:hypothetical protein CVD28_11030 [Bacillus sp. M6-12]
MLVLEVFYCTFTKNFISRFLRESIIKFIGAYSLLQDGQVSLKGERILPIWIWFVVAGIIVSAVMAVRTARLERVQEQEWIEQEGQKYIDRINEDKEKKNQFQPGA